MGEGHNRSIHNCVASLMENCLVGFLMEGRWCRAGWIKTTVDEAVK